MFFRKIGDLSGKIVKKSFTFLGICDSIGMTFTKFMEGYLLHSLCYRILAVVLLLAIFAGTVAFAMPMEVLEEEVILNGADIPREHCGLLRGGVEGSYVEEPASYNLRLAPGEKIL